MTLRKHVKDIRRGLILIPTQGGTRKMLNNLWVFFGVRMAVIGMLVWMIFKLIQSMLVAL